MEPASIRDRLASWLAAQWGDARDVRVDGLERAELGYSSETLLLTIACRAGGVDHTEDVVLRMRPPKPGLLEPYDLERQFDILRALEPTPVRAPRVLWFEGSGAVLGREFYVMERVGGTVYESTIPDELRSDPRRVRRMSHSMLEQLAAIHTVDLHATGIDAIGDGHGYLDRELDHWAGEIRRWKRAPLPGLERLVSAVRASQPEQCPTVTLVHGDPKPGNFAFEGEEVSAVFDWELASVGDPLADIAWADLLWSLPGSFTSLPGSLSPDEFVSRYEDLTGITVRHREWYRAFQGLKMAVILLVGAMLFDAGHTDDLRLGELGYAIPFMTRRALGELGIDEDVEHGPVSPREERLAEVRGRASARVT